MLLKTRGIVLRGVKYGETSLVVTIFTEHNGVQTYMIQGVRTGGARGNKAGFFQPGTLLELVVYQQQQKNLQRIKEYSAAHIYRTVLDDIVKNSIVMFSVELLLRLLPEEAPLPSLFHMAFGYFTTLDRLSTAGVANFPLRFAISCADELGYDLKGNYTPGTPYLNLQEGGFSDHPPATVTMTTQDDARLLSALMEVADITMVKEVEMSGEVRMRLLDWYIAFLQQHTQHMGNIRSLPLLHAILH